MHKPTETLHHELDGKLADIRRQISEFGRVMVAFSGGVDSTLVAVLARQTLGRADVLAVTADSPSIAREDLDEARRLAGHLAAVRVGPCPKPCPIIT